jgi:hypothetical protein
LVAALGLSGDLGKVDTGQAIAGSAKKVEQTLSDQVSRGGLNYVIGSFMFRSMLHADATASVIRFAEEVAPARSGFRMTE